MNKKLLAVFSLLMSMTMLAACGGGETSSSMDSNVNSESTSVSAPEESSPTESVEPECTHENKEAKSDDANHWLECECGETFEVEAHVAGTEVKYDETNHWNECECGYEMNVTAHTLVGGSNETHHWGACDCGYEAEQVAHDYSVAKSDETHHWNECVCGAIDEKVEHSYDTANYDDTHHWNECSCGAIDEKVEHVAGEDWYSTESEHFQECECGYKMNAGAHESTKDWTIESDVHWKECDTCGWGVDYAEHNLVGSFVDDVYTLSCECGLEVDVTDTIEFFDRENKNYILADGTMKENVKDGVNQGNYWDGASNIVTVGTQSEVTCNSDSAIKLTYNFSLLTEDQLNASEVGWAGWKNDASMWVGYAIPLNNLNVNNLELVFDMKVSNMNPSLVIYSAADYEGEENAAYVTGTQMNINVANAKDLGDGWYRYTVLLADTVSVAEAADYIVFSLDNTASGLDKKAESIAYIDNVSLTNIVTYTVTVDGEAQTVRKNASFSVANPERAGYEFLGWQYADGNEVQLPITVTGDVEIVSAWNKLPVPVKANETKVEVDLSALPADADYEEYTFTAPAGTYNVIVSGDVYAAEIVDGQIGEEITQFVFTEETTVIFGITFATGQTGAISIVKEIDAGLEESKFLEHLFQGVWDYTDDKRAFVNRMDPSAVITEEVPAGFAKKSQFIWLQTSTSQWKAGGNPYYRGSYNQSDISAYKALRFGVLVETDGDAYFETANGLKIRNEWLIIQLEQTAANVWTMSVLNEAGEVLYGASNVTRVINALTDIDSLASIVFPSAWQDSQRTQALVLYPCSSQEMTASVYTTEVLGYAEPFVYDPEFAEGSVEISTTALNTGWNYGVNTNWITALPAQLSESDADYDLADGYSKVSKIESSTGWTSSIIGGGAYGEVDISGYSDIWFAMKVVNGHFTQTKPAWKDIDSNAVADWLYFHAYQTGKNADGYNLWSIEITVNGVVWGTLTEQTAFQSVALGETINKLIDNDSDSGRIVIYHAGSGTAKIYASEVIGLKKPFDPEISESATEVMAHVYNAHYFGENCGAVTGGSQTAPDAVWSEEAAPAGFSKVIEYNWSSTTQKDFGTGRLNTMDLSGYSELYFAMKVVGEGTGIYVQGQSTKYTSGGWLYVYLRQNDDGTWTKTVRSADGFSLVNCQTTVPGNTLVTMSQYTSGNNAGTYPTKPSDGTAMIYFTEVLGVAKA